MKNTAEYILDIAKSQKGCYAIMTSGGEVLAEYEHQENAEMCMEYYEQYGATKIKYIAY